MEFENVMITHHYQVEFISKMQRWFAIYKVNRTQHLKCRRKITYHNRYKKKVFDKMPHPFTIKLKEDIERAYLNIIKATYKEPTVITIHNVEKWKTFPLRLGRRQGYSLTTFIQHSTGSSTHTNPTRIKKHPS